MTDILEKLLKYKSDLEAHQDCINSFNIESLGETDEHIRAMDRFAEFLSDTESLFK